MPFKFTLVSGYSGGSHVMQNGGKIRDGQIGANVSKFFRAHIGKASPICFV